MDNTELLTKAVLALANRLEETGEAVLELNITSEEQRAILIDDTGDKVFIEYNSVVDIFE